MSDWSYDSPRQKVRGHELSMNAHEKSDTSVVSGKRSNKAGPSAAESVEKRGVAKGNAGGRSASRTLSRILRQTRSPACMKQQRAVACYDPRQEPYAVIPHVRICTGGAG